MKRNGTKRGNRTRRAFLSSCGLILIIAARPLPTSAQDLKPISSSLAAQISASGRKTVAVVDFTDLKGNVTELGRFLAEEVSVDLVGAAKGYEIIDRTHLVSILQEHKLASTGLIDPQTARKLGQIAGVDAIVTGTITPLGETIRLSAKVLDTGTAKMIAASTADIPKTPAIDVLMKEGVSGTQTGDSATSAGTAQTSSPPASSGQVSVRQGDFLFTLRGCWLSGGSAQAQPSIFQPTIRDISYTPQQASRNNGSSTLDCLGFVTNKSEKRQQVELQSGSIVDDVGNQYDLRYGNVLFSNRRTSQELEPDLPINFSFSLGDLNPGATHINIFLSYGSGFNGSKVAIRNIAIQKK